MGVVEGGGAVGSSMGESVARWMEGERVYLPTLNGLVQRAIAADDDHARMRRVAC